MTQEYTGTTVKRRSSRYGKYRYERKLVRALIVSPSWHAFRTCLTLIHLTRYTRKRAGLTRKLLP